MALSICGVICFKLCHCRTSIGSPIIVAVPLKKSRKVHDDVIRPTIAHGHSYVTPDNELLHIYATGSIRSYTMTRVNRSVVALAYGTDEHRWWYATRDD